MLEIFKPKSENLFNNTFFLGQTLGDGNFAIVKTAIDKATKNGVAIKIIDKEKLKGKEGMMINEIRIMRKLDHDHCVKLVSWTNGTYQFPFYTLTVNRKSNLTYSILFISLTDNSPSTIYTRASHTSTW